MNKIQSRHWTFIGLFVLIIIVMLFQIDLKLETSAQTQKMFDYIENLPPNSNILISFDHEASSLPEIKPISLALCRHAFSKGHKIIGMALFAEGTVIGYRLLQQTAKEYNLEYGKDYVFLGFKPQFIAAISSLGESFSKTFPEDYVGNKYDSIPMLKNINNYDDITAVISIADGNLTTHWMEYGGSRFDVTIIGGITAAMVTSYDPYISSGQMFTMIA
ncbi:MAG: hypothetical protein U9N54_00075, partial [candidate division Zixibacteria bacterium]|nr:hypothetical protein [candidate division Zixibacteria bacterium]